MMFSRKVEFVVRAAVLGSLTFGLTCAPAAAATASNSMSVSATVQAACTATAATVAFGSHAGAAANANSAVSVTCTNATPYTVGLSTGAASIATVNARKMTGPAAGLLSYSLFSDPSRALNWGQTAGSGAVQALTVYGQAPARQLAPSPYTDTVIATITY